MIAQVKSDDIDFGWGVVVNFCKKSNVKVSQYLVVTCLWMHFHVTSPTSTYSFRRAQTQSRCMWWRSWSIVVKRALRMQRLRLLSLQLQGRLERCRCVNVLITNTNITSCVCCQVICSGSVMTFCFCLFVFFVQVVPVMLQLLTSISSVRLYIPKDLRPYDNRQLMLKSIQVQNTAILKCERCWN